MQLQGFIRNTSSRSGKGKKPPYRLWTSYNAEIHADSGEITKISFGFDKPEVGEGDYVKLEAFDKNGFLEVDQSTIERLDPPKQVAAAGSSSAGTGSGGAAAQGGTSGNGVVADSSQGNFAPAQYGYQTHPTDAKRITFSAAHDRALKTVGLLLQYDALPHSKAKGKGGEAQRYQELIAAIDKLTVKIFNDSLTLRTLDVIADEGIIDVKPQSQLPDDGPGSSNNAPNPLDD